ncbi:hypothetical protein LJR034_009303 [Caballeronia sp. LjRoot34]|uniref:hypothetical protein n=1 Tax=Caballeronia sp. LjRoot34 TaxID=3342325 RepID=UPI003ECFAB03
MFQGLKRLFWPPLPAQVSEESADALRADLTAAGVWRKHIGQANRNAVDVWVRHSDNMKRANNRECLRPQAKVFALRWRVLSAVLWLFAWISSKTNAFGVQVMVVEVVLTLAALATGVVAMAFLSMRRALRK